MNKKGFTLVEILATIVLIALLLGLGIPGVMKISENMKKRAYNTKVNLIEQAGTLWGQDNKTRLQSAECDIDGVGKNIKCYKIHVKELIENDYISSDAIDYNVSDSPLDNTIISNNYVYVYKKNNRVYAYLSDELAFELPSYTYEGDNFVFNEEEYNQYSVEGNKFYYQTINDCKPNNTNWIKFENNSATIVSGDNIVFVKMVDSENNEFYVSVRGFKVCTSDNIVSGGWHQNNFNITIVSKDPILYSWDTASYNKKYFNPIEVKNVTDSKTLYIKSGTKNASYECKLDKEAPEIVGNDFSVNYIPDSYDVKLSATISDDLGISGYKFIEGNNCDDGTAYTPYSTNLIETIINVSSDKNITLCVIDIKGNSADKTKNVPKNDFLSPTIVDYKVTYNTNDASATLSANIKDNVSLAGYLFTTNTNCPTDKNSYEPISGVEQNISKNIGVTEGNYYLCVIDQKENPPTISNAPQYVANCKVTGDYYFTCKTLSDYLLGKTIDYDFYNIFSNNNRVLTIAFHTPVRWYDRSIKHGENSFIDSGDLNNTDWWLDCDNHNPLNFMIRVDGIECYNTSIYRR